MQIVNDCEDVEHILAVSLGITNVITHDPHITESLVENRIP